MGGVGGPELQVCIGPQHPRRRRAPPLHRTAMIAIASAVSRLDLARGKAALHLGLCPVTHLRNARSPCIMCGAWAMSCGTSSSAILSRLPRILGNPSPQGTGSPRLSVPPMELRREDGLYYPRVDRRKNLSVAFPHAIHIAGKAVRSQFIFIPAVTARGRISRASWRSFALEEWRPSTLNTRSATVERLPNVPC